MEKERKELVNSVIGQMEKVKNSIIKKLNTKGYVVAGYGGDTYYSFVGLGNGYQGAALSPVSTTPIIFECIIDANREANNGIYRNGKNEIIHLQVIKSSKYFEKIYKDFEKTIEQTKELFK